MIDEDVEALLATVHRPAAVADTSVLRRRCAAAFAAPPPRGRMRLFGREGHIRRDALWFADADAEGFVPLYRTAGHGPPRNARHLAAAMPVPAPVPDWMARALRALERAVDGLDEGALNHVVLHRYVDGADTIGPHHDKTRDLVRGAPILSLSVGATRAFRVGRATFAVRDGDLVVLPWAVNRAVKHGVPVRRRAAGVRYSLTARCVATRYPPTRRRVRVATRREGKDAWEEVEY